MFGDFYLFTPETGTNTSAKFKKGLLVKKLYPYRINPFKRDCKEQPKGINIYNDLCLEKTWLNVCVMKF